MPEIRPVSDLRNKFTEISRIIHDNDEPIVFTRNGHGDFVVISIEQYDVLLRALHETGRSLPRRVLTIDEIKSAVSGIAAKHKITKVTLIGSYADGKATKQSDVDLLVENEKRFTLFDLSGFKLDMEQALGRDVDVITINNRDELDIQNEVDIYG